MNNNRKIKIRQKSKSQKMLQFMKIITYTIIIIGFMGIDQFVSFRVSAQKPLVERGQKPIGAYRIFPKTTFSCLGRPAGYYADIQTGCQVYHMCDGLGRQFSYSCPNTTLFQQRMLICDHWYMVNCSKAESDYAANLLIGQRDKPFVPEEENQLRTPRPDLLDRPYAPDYSGESYRNQYKDSTQILNEINDSDGADKQHLNEINSPSPTRWHLPRESSTEIRSSNPYLIRRNDIIEENNGVDLGASYSSNYNSSADFSVETSSSFIPTRSTTIRPISTTMSFTTTAKPFRSTTTFTSTTGRPISTTTKYVKPPSRLYEPPFLYPIYNLNYTEENEDQESSTISTITPTTTNIVTTTISPTTSTTQQIMNVTSTTEPFTTRSTLFSGKSFSNSFETTSGPSVQTFSTTFTPTTTENYNNFVSRSQLTRSTSKPKSFVTKTQSSFKYSTTSEKPSDVPTPFLDLLPPAIDRISDPEPFKPKSDKTPSSNELPALPSNILLPPFQEFKVHDVATTQGPPIYFEWKIPSNALEPPKFDPPPGAEEDNQQQSKDDIISAGSTAIAENYTTNSPFSHNPFLSSIIKNNHNNQQSTQNSIRVPTVRSVPRTVPTSQPIFFSTRRHNNDNDDNGTAKIDENLATAEASHLKKFDIQQLQKDYFIPDFLFPLDTDARIGYEQSDVLNSFQLKIPERRDNSNNNNNNNKWYGENPDCPECHPSFVKPGKCEPCVRR